MMNNVMKYLSLMIFLCVMLIFSSREANAQSYFPVGPQTNVPVDTVTGGGWTECYRDLYSNHMDADTVLSSCPGTPVSRLMLSCRPTGSDTLTLLAQGKRSDVTFDTGDTEFVVHEANGVGWYFNNGPSDNHGFSWGFVREGDSVDKGNCDVDSSGASDERLCWHLNDSGGYRCGATQGLNDSDSFERIVYVASSRSTPIPTLSQWGLIAMAGLMGVVGFIMVIRRRKVVV